jgi:hypothetical protein
VTDFAVFAPSESNLYVQLNNAGATSYPQEFGLFGSVSVYNEPPLTPSLGSAVRKTAARRSAAPQAAATGALRGTAKRTAMDRRPSTHPLTGLNK